MIFKKDFLSSLLTPFLCNCSSSPDVCIYGTSTCSCVFFFPTIKSVCTYVFKCINYPCHTSTKSRVFFFCFSCNFPHYKVRTQRVCSIPPPSFLKNDEKLLSHSVIKHLLHFYGRRKRCLTEPPSSQPSL